MKSFWTEIFVKLGIPLIKMIVIAGILSGLGLFMLIASVEIINYINTGWFTLQILSGSVAVNVEEYVKEYLSLFYEIIPGDVLVMDILGLGDIFDGLNLDFFAFMSEITNSIKNGETISKNVSSVDIDILFREFAQIALSSFVMIEIIRIGKILFKYGGIGVCLGFIYGAIYWIGASYAFSECVLVFLEKILFENILGYSNLLVLYAVVVVLFFGLEVIIGTCISKNVVKSSLKVLINFFISFVKTFITWFFVQMIVGIIRLEIAGQLEMIMLNEITLGFSMLICFALFILLTVLQEKLLVKAGEKEPTRDDYEKLGIIKWFSKIFKPYI